MEMGSESIDYLVRGEDFVNFTTLGYNSSSSSNSSSNDNSTTDVLLSDSDLLAVRLGERYMAEVPLVILNIIYIAIFASGIFGNVCTCVVIARNR